MVSDIIIVSIASVIAVIASVVTLNFWNNRARKDKQIEVRQAYEENISKVAREKLKLEQSLSDEFRELRVRLDSHDKCLKRLEEAITALRDQTQVDKQDVKMSTKEDKVDLKLELGSIREDIKSVETFLRENIPPLKRRGKSNI